MGPIACAPVFASRHASISRMKPAWVSGCAKEGLAHATGFAACAAPAHGARRSAEYEKPYPFASLGLRSDTPPASDESIYVNRPRRFSRCSQRPAQATDQ